MTRKLIKFTFILMFISAVNYAREGDLSPFNNEVRFKYAQIKSELGISEIACIDDIVNTSLNYDLNSILKDLCSPKTIINS